MDIAEMTALELGAQIRNGDVSIIEVVDNALARAHADTHGAFVHIADAYARERAHQLQKRLRDPNFQPGPLFGVPCPIKDLTQVEGMPFEAGSAAMRGNIARANDGVVRRFHEAGTITMGKTATPEFGLPCYTEPEGRPPASTPWDPTRNAGGSSGGAAAAVATNVVALAHGNDGGGSIRIPASSCGVVGLKPSRGRVSRGPLMPDGPGLAADGVLSRDVRDTAAALDALAGPWPGESYGAPASQESFLDALERPGPRLRVGVLTDPVIDENAPVHPVVIEAVHKTATTLTSLGHRVDSAPVPFRAEKWQAFQAVWSVGALSIPLPPDRESMLRPLTRWLRDQGRAVSGIEYAAAVTGMQEVTREVAAQWDEFDVILTPTLAQPPAKHHSLRNDDDPAADFVAQTRFTPWTSIYNISGRPAISLPLHTAEVDGVRLPVGIMLGAPMFGEATLLRLAAELEATA